MADNRVAQAVYGIRFLEALATAPSNLGTGRVGLWADSSGRLRFGSSSSYSLLSVSNTLPALYSAGTDQDDSTIGLDSTRLGIRIRDNATPIAGYLFEVQDSGGTKNFFNIGTGGFGSSGALALGGTAGNGWVYLANESAATGGAPTQSAPEIWQVGTAWDGSASRTIGSRLELATSATGASYAVRSRLRLQRNATVVTALSANYDGTTIWVGGGATTRTADLGQSTQEWRNVFGAHVLNRTDVADADYVQVNGDGYIGYSSLSTARQVTLLAATALAGRVVWVVNETSDTSTITVTSASTIRGTATIAAAYGASGSVRCFLSTGTEWISLTI